MHASALPGGSIIMPSVSFVLGAARRARFFRALRVAWALALAVAVALVAGCTGSSTATPTAAAPAAGTAAPAASAAAKPTATPTPREVTFMAGYTPQANLPFVAVYVADAQGYFADEGLKVNIQHSSGNDEHLKLLVAGKVDFTTGTAAQLLVRREQGLPDVAVALFGQRGDQAFVTRADSGITKPADFKGHSVGFKAGVVPPELEAMLAGAGLSDKDVQLQAVGYDPRVFTEGKVDVYPVFIDNEPDTIRNAGVPINVLDPANFGVPTLGLVYETRADLVKSEPDVVTRFLRATLRATAWIQDHIDEAIQITLKWATGADAAHQKFMLQTDLQNAQRADGIGRSDPQQWQDLYGVLKKYGVLTKDMPDPASVFDGTFVNQLYTSGQIKPGGAR
jgi:ABC-type nitrate/sulfonate/bicarbonate transport system substrate-binding protein